MSNNSQPNGNIFVILSVKTEHKNPVEMKNKLTVLLVFAAAMITSSCGTASLYSSSYYDDGIYSRPDRNSRALIVAEKQKEEVSEEYVARDDDGGLWLIREGNKGTYASRLHRFDSPFYSFNFNFGFWGDPWFNPYFRWGYWSDPWYRWHYPWWDPWIDPWYRPWPYDPWPYRPWYRPWPYDPWPYPGPGPAPAPTPGRGAIYTPRTTGNSGIMRTTGGGFSYGTSHSGGTTSSSSYGRRTSGSSTPTKSGVTRTTNARRSSGTTTTRTTNSSYNSNSYNNGGSYNSGGFSTSGGGNSGGGSHPTGTGTHTGGGRR